MRTSQMVARRVRAGLVSRADCLIPVASTLWVFRSLYEPLQTAVQNKPTSADAGRFKRPIDDQFEELCLPNTRQTRGICHPDSKRARALRRRR